MSFVPPIRLDETKAIGVAAACEVVTEAWLGDYGVAVRELKLSDTMGI